MQNGLNDPEKQWQGSWGGRFGSEIRKNVNIIAQGYAGADCKKGCFVNEEPYLDYWMFADAVDSWSYEGNTFENVWCSIFRWRTDFQNDFAVRMDWCIKYFKDANHNPIAVIDGNDTKNVLYKEARIGTSIQIDATEFHDPDGNKLNYEWWIYKEAGTYEGEVKVENASSMVVAVNIPSDSNGKTIHVLLTLRDNGTPLLTSY